MSEFDYDQCDLSAGESDRFDSIVDDFRRDYPNNNQAWEEAIDEAANQVRLSLEYKASFRRARHQAGLLKAVICAIAEPEAICDSPFEKVERRYKLGTQIRRWDKQNPDYPG